MNSICGADNLNTSNVTVYHFTIILPGQIKDNELRMSMLQKEKKIMEEN
ncbi:MAG: hypothetical protein AAFQ91_22175 [Cyanobacteria bacterium J06621_15]